MNGGSDDVLILDGWKINDWLEPDLLIIQYHNGFNNL